jgi:cell division protein FtsB
LSGSPPASSTTFRSLLGIGALALLLLLALGGLKGYRDLDVARHREQELADELAAKQARIRALESRIEDLRADPATLEKLAREELLMVRPGDVVVVLAEPAQPGAVEATTAGSPEDDPRR